MKCKKCGEFFCDRFCPKCGEIADGEEYYRELLSIENTDDELKSQLEKLTEDTVKDSLKNKGNSKAFESKFTENSVEYSRKTTGAEFPKTNTNTKAEVFAKANNTTVNTNVYPRVNNTTTNTENYPKVSNTTTGGYGNSNVGNRGYTPRSTPTVSPFPNNRTKKTSPAIVVVIIVVCAIIVGNFILNNINIDGDIFDEPIADFSDDFDESYTDYYSGETYVGDDYDLTYVNSLWYDDDDDYQVLEVQWEISGDVDLFDPDNLQCKTEDQSDVDCTNSDEFYDDDFFEETDEGTYLFYTYYQVPYEEDTVRILYDDSYYEELPCFVVENY